MKTVQMRWVGASMLALIWATGSGAALAADAGATATTGSGAIDEIVVTTRRASENLQNVPLAITVTSADQLQARGITDLQAVARYTPSLSFEDYVTGFNGNPTIRGMAQLNVANPITNVGVFVDGIYLQRTYQVNLSLGDFERIEVVKGPQSALYGSNTFAGAINYVTKAPSDTFTANAEATIGSAGARRFQAGVGGPIIEGVLSGRLFLGSASYDGTVRNNLPTARGDEKYFGGYSRQSMSAALRFKPIAGVTIDAYYSHNDKSEGIRPYYTISGRFAEDKTNCGAVNSATGRPGLFCGVFVSDPSAYRTGVGARPTGLFSNTQPKATGENDLYRLSAEWVVNDALTAQYTFGATRASASENFSFFSNNYNPTVTPGVATFSQQIEGGKIDYHSHELRLVYDGGGPIKLEGGYFRSKAHDTYLLGVRPVAITGGVLPPFTRFSEDALFLPPGTITLNNLNQTFSVDAIFGRASYAFLEDRAKLTAELRHTWTDLKFIDGNRPTFAPLMASYKAPAPRFTGEFKLTPDTLLYASAARGLKSGGFNGYASGTLTLLPDEQSFGEEKNWTYELGAKNSFFDRRLFLNVDVFYIDWTSKIAQLAPSNLPANTTGALTTVANIYKSTGSATNYGIEIEGQYKPVRSLSINFAFSAQDPTYSKGSKSTAFVGFCTVGTCPVDGSIEGNTLERQSKYSAAVGVEYRNSLAGGYEWFTGLDATYQSKQYSDQMNLGITPSYTLFNGRIGVENDNWRLFVWGKNLFDKFYVANAFYIQNQQQYTASFGEKRTVGVTLAGKF